MVSARFSLVLSALLQCIAAQVSSSTSIPSVPSSSISTVTGVATSVSQSQNATATTSTTTEDVTAIVGLSPSNASGNGTASATTSIRPRPSNTRPCNGHVEFCDRKFSNISMVVAHNSPFVRPHNAASNQLYPVLNQLNDGIRGRKYKQIHYFGGLTNCVDSTIRDPEAQFLLRNPALSYILRSARCGNSGIIPCDSKRVARLESLRSNRDNNGQQQRPGYSYPSNRLRPTLHRLRDPALSLDPILHQPEPHRMAHPRRDDYQKQARSRHARLRHRPEPSPLAPQRIRLPVGNPLLPHRPLLPMHATAAPQPGRRRIPEPHVHDEPQPEH